jgi:hypothetical protein
MKILSFYYAFGSWHADVESASARERVMIGAIITDLNERYPTGAPSGLRRCDLLDELRSRYADRPWVSLLP